MGSLLVTAIWLPGGVTHIQANDTTSDEDARALCGRRFGFGSFADSDDGHRFDPEAEGRSRAQRYCKKCKRLVRDVPVGHIVGFVADRWLGVEPLPPERAANGGAP